MRHTAPAPTVGVGSMTRRARVLHDPSRGDEQLAGNYRPFCGFKCWSDYMATVVAPDVNRDEPTCPTCGAES